MGQYPGAIILKYMYIFIEWRMAIFNQKFVDDLASAHTGILYPRDGALRLHSQIKRQKDNLASTSDVFIYSSLYVHKGGLKNPFISFHLLCLCRQTTLIGRSPRPRHVWINKQAGYSIPTKVGPASWTVDQHWTNIFRCLVFAGIKVTGD